MALEDHVNKNQVYANQVQNNHRQNYEKPDHIIEQRNSQRNSEVNDQAQYENLRRSNINNEESPK